MIARLAFSVSILSLLVLSPVAVSAEPIAEKLDAIFTVWDRPESPGLAVIVVQDGSATYKKGFGSANLEHRLPNTPTTAFNIGSVSKQFTAFAIVLLAKAGKLSLDDPVRKHIPEVPDFGKQLTVRHLLHHTSGLREDWSLLAMSGTRSEDVIRRDDILRLVSRQKELNFDPGAEYLYCNTGYDLLAEVVRRVSGQPLREFARERIFLPAGMKSTDFCDDHRQIVPGRAMCYRPRVLGGFEHVHFATERAGPSNLFTTAEDMAKWAAYSEKLEKVDPTLSAEILRRGKLNDGKELSYAAGIQHGSYRGAKLIFHNGSTAGYRATLHRYPDHRLAVAILSNLASVNADQLAYRVADVILDKKLGPRVATGKKAEAAPRPEKTSEPAPGVLKAYVGKYYSEELETLYTVEYREGRLFVIQPKGEARLQSAKTDRFTAVGPDSAFETLEFTRTKSGAVSGLAISTARARNVRFVKVEIQPIEK